MTVFASRRDFLRSAGLAATATVLPAASWSAGSQPAPRGTDRHKVLCCNIRVDLPQDEERGFGWKTRRDVCTSVMHAHSPDIICTQEVLHGQKEDLKRAFPGFQSFGFEGPEMLPILEGYHLISKNVIFYSRDRYELISAGGYWLSETPHIGGSRSWGTARARQVNWVWLEDKATRQQFRVVNTHLDHRSQEAREKQIAMILEEAAQYPEEFPQLLTADFNVDARNPVYRKLIRKSWENTYASVHGEADPGYTFHAFHGKRFPEEVPPERIKGQIDFIFGKGPLKTQSASIIRDEIKGVYPSDHYFISAEVSLG